MPFDALTRVANSLDKNADIPLRIRIFRLISLTTAALCLGLVMPVNLLQNLDIRLHVVNVLLGLFGAFVFWQSLRGRHLVLTFLVGIVGMLDLAWFWNGGSHGSVPYFFLPALVYALAMFRGHRQRLIAVLFPLNVIALLVLEVRYPEWVIPFATDQDRHLDLITGVVCSFAAVTAVLAAILASHDREQQRISQFAERLRTSEQAYREIFNSTNDALFVHGPDGRLLDVNERAELLFGTTKDDLLRSGFNTFCLGQPPYSESEAGLLLQRALRGEPQLCEWRSRRRDGTLFWSEVALRVGQIGGEQRVIAAVRDISERKRVDEALRRNEERLRLSLIASGQGWFELNVQTGLGESSPEYVRMIGHDPETYRTTLEGWVAGIHPDDRAALVRAYEECVRKGDTRTMEYRRQTKSGAWKWIRSVGRIVEYDEAGRPLRMYGTHADVTERKELEAQLLHSQRLEAVGTLASGVAHDLNNILTPMLMATGVLRESLTNEHDREMMALLDSGGRRGAAIVKQLLDFSRNLTRERVAVDPAHVLEETAQWMRSTLPSSIEVTVSVAPGLPAIHADPTQIHQVLINLCVNARDAMPGGGRLILAADVVDWPESTGNPAGDPAGGRQVVLTVTDTGSGISPEIADRIFDPFFTTKGPGKGTGLGLASVHGIVKAHGGLVRMESAPGKGSTFRVFLPAFDGGGPPPPSVTRPAAAAEAETPAAAAAPAPETPPMKPAGCILVVDDEESVRLVTRRRLEREGYWVLVAASGPEALRILREADHPVHVVVSDFAMPGMDGPTLAPLIRELRPSVRIIGMSGHDYRGREAEMAALGFAEILGKPYVSSELLAAIARQLPNTAAPEASGRP